MRIGTFAVMAVLALAVPAAAQPTTTKADKLFNEGRELLEAGKYKEACDRFEASLREADALGTRLNLALCMEKRGKLHSAVVKYDDTADRAERAGQTDSAKVAREHADALRNLVPTLTIQLTAPVPGQRVLIQRPGEEDREINPSAPVPVDPTDPNDPDDKITVASQAEGYAWYTSPPITVLPKVAGRAPPPPVVVPALIQEGGGEVRPPPPPPGKSHRKLYGILAGVGGVALITGSAIWAKAESSAVDDACAEKPDECQDGYSGSAASHFNKLRYGASGLFVVGVAAVGLGAYLFFTAPKGTEAERTAVVPAIGPDGAGVAVLGHF